MDSKNDDMEEARNLIKMKRRSNLGDELELIDKALSKIKEKDRKTVK